MNAVGRLSVPLLALCVSGLAGCMTASGEGATISLKPGASLGS